MLQWDEKKNWCLYKKIECIELIFIFQIVFVIFTCVDMSWVGKSD